MDFYAVLDETVALLRSRGRVSYRALKEHFGVDDERVDALRSELLYAYPDEVRADEHGLGWTVGRRGERRQLTVCFCDLVGSTTLAGRFDPEDWREIIAAYYDTCGKVIARFEGHIAQYLGDGLLIYFGYPRAHEDDAQRAVRAGLGIIDAVGRLNAVLSEKRGVSLAVRLGCHTGLVVVGDEVGGTGHDDMVLGDTPNIAARLQALAEPNTLVIGGLTHQLLGGVFACEPLGAPRLKGVDTPVEAYRVMYESTARTRLDALADTGLTPLIGRQSELQLLEKAWQEVRTGQGQVVLVTGEAGIGKSRLVKALTEHAAREQAWFTHLQCSPYYQHTAFYPVIDLLERIVLRFGRDETPTQKQRKLEGLLVESGLPLAETVPLFSSLLSIPLGAEYVSLEMSGEQLKQQTMRALLTIPLRRAEKQPVMLIVEDLHWIDPSTLEYLRMLADEIRAAPILALFTTRPDFESPWTEHPDVAVMELRRLPGDAAAELSRQVAQGKSLPLQVQAEVVAKTDGVPLFIEELTKMLLESGLLEERRDHYVLTGLLPPLAIPSTLQDSLMARLDRLAPVKGLAQLCATLGREFNYSLLQAVSPWDHRDLRHGLEQLVTSEFLHQDGIPPEAAYRFKHALIQDAAYQSLLKSTRQQHHQRIANTLESAFPETVESQPELLAHHYTEAGLAAQAIVYWQIAGRRALQRSANREAASHAARGLELLSTLPETPDLAKHELSLQLTLGGASGFVTGPQSVEHVFARACELAREVGSALELFPALSGLAHSKMVLGHMHEARALSEEFLQLAQRHDDPLILAVGHSMLAYTAWWQGDLVNVRDHSGQSLALYNPQQHSTGFLPYDQDHGIVSGYLAALSKWMLGYPIQAIQAMEATLAHARELHNPNSVGISLLFLAQLHQLRREPEPATARAQEALALAAEHGLPALELWCLLPRGWAAAYRGDFGAGIADIRESMHRRASIGMGAVWPWYFALLAETQCWAGQIDDGLTSVEEGLGWVERNDERLYEAEIHRIKGELLLRHRAHAHAESCFEKALAVARGQHAKFWELRAAMGLARLWRQVGRREDAHALLTPIHAWFTEGFDTADLCDVKHFVDELDSHSRHDAPLN
ncbi:AAA family ATPase [Mycobacterium sp. 3519A]|uniref:ATP-binding protein n=1 Tax=Mycobacterium sp. 3519A TaxID=2057184 RepID=UPI000C7E4830|nr:AAA family ATPase [Mycobacterium sp. 3519A]